MPLPLPLRLFLVAAMVVPMLAIDAVILNIIARQYLGADLSQTPGIITHSQVVSEGDETYAFEVRYTYSVRGLTYEGDRYRYASWSGPRDSVEVFARRFPEGARVPVFYDPAVPWDAVLVTGVEGMSLFHLLFASPFNVAMLLGAWHLLRGKGEDPLNLGSRHQEPSPLVVGLAAGGGAAFVAVFVLAGLLSFDPPLIVPVLLCGAVLATGVYFARRQRTKSASRRTQRQRARAARRASAG